MRKILQISIVFLLILGINTSTGSQSITLSKQKREWHKKILRRDLLLDGIMYKETRHGKVMVSKASLQEHAVGIIQIRPGMIKYLNTRCKTHFKLSDRNSVEKSIQIFLTFQELFNPNFDIDLGAHIWNAGPSRVMSRWVLTNNYRKDLKNYLEKKYKYNKNNYI